MGKYVLSALFLKRYTFRIVIIKQYNCKEKSSKKINEFEIKYSASC